jgi:hypothetical protein
MGFGLMFMCGALSLPGVWYGGLRDFSYAALQFAPILLLWTAMAARASACHTRLQGVAATIPEVPA